MNTNTLLTNFIWIAPWGEKENTTPLVVCFRKTFALDSVPSRCRIRITADSRYKLYVNGCFLQEGPSKGTPETWYADNAELAPLLRPGENVVAVEVLRYPADMAKRNHSLHRTEYPCLYVEDMHTFRDSSALPAASGTTDACDEAFSSRPVLEGRSGWKCRIHRGISFTGEPFRPAPLHILENSCGIPALHGWMQPGYHDRDWADARPYPSSFCAVRIAESPFHLKERTIPPQRHTERCFLKTVCIREGAVQISQWNDLLTRQKALCIPSHTRQVVELDAGELTTGYLILRFAGGRGSRLTIHCAECYSYEVPSGEPGGAPVILKGDRSDYRNGRLHGVCDHYTVCGCADEGLPESWESYWFRTFRYIGLTVETNEEPLKITKLSYRETGYPLNVQTEITVSDNSLAKVWDISLRTLKRCMHETYFDCPFYEQLQYAMDARSEILYTYAVAADDRLARKTIEDFRYSQRSDGLLNSCAPSVRTNVIPGFSVFYILMVHDHMMYFGDKTFLRQQLPAIDAILEFFHRNLTSQGLVGSIGGPHLCARYWSFIDWTPQWSKTGGVPTACLQKTGALTQESLLYLMGLTKAAELSDYLDRPDTAAEYRERAAALKQALSKHCFGMYLFPDGSRIRLMQDGPSVEEYSVHCQVFAILNNLVSASEGKAMLSAVLGKPERFAQCSVAMQFYLFRALEQTDWYEKTADLWNLWRKMVTDHMTTCVENDTDARSDCHAWAATILYELPCVSLGVTPAAPGYTKVRIRPHTGYFSSCSGNVITPKGMIHVDWKKEPSGSCRLSCQVPEKLPVIFQ